MTRGAICARGWRSRALLFPPSSFRLPQFPTKKDSLDNGGRCHLPGQHRAAISRPLWWLPQVGTCLPHFAQSGFEYLIFTDDEKGQELWNSTQGQNGDLLGRSDLFSYSDIWRPLPEQIRANPRSVWRGGLPVVTLHWLPWGHRNSGSKQGSHRIRFATLALQT